MTFPSREQREREEANRREAARQAEMQRQREAERQADAQRQRDAERQAALQRGRESASKAAAQRLREAADEAIARMMTSPLPSSIRVAAPLPDAAQVVDDVLGASAPRLTMGELWMTPLKPLLSWVRNEAERVRDRCTNAGSFERIVCRQIVNALPPLGLGRLIAGSSDAREVERMLDALEGDGR